MKKIGTWLGFMAGIVVTLLITYHTGMLCV